MKQVDPIPPKSLNIKILQEYCNILIGKHDFTSFSALSDTNKSKIRYLHSIKIDKNNDLIIIKIIGNAFLHKMIRTIVGTILKLHRFEMPVSEMEKILKNKDRRSAGPTFTPRGLIFKKIYYEAL